MSDIESRSFDPIWETRYREQPSYRSYYPWTSIVAFVFTHTPQRPRSEVTILEVGCGAGNNLWFAAREGFQVAGIDASETAIAFARDRFRQERLEGDLRVGDFTALPFADDTFDLVFDRSALSFCGRRSAARAIVEIRRVLKPGGRFLFNPYSDRSTSFHLPPDADGLVHQVRLGTIVGGSQVRFYSLQEVRDSFSVGWELLSLKHIEQVEYATPERVTHAEWLVVAMKTVAPQGPAVNDAG